MLDFLVFIPHITIDHLLCARRGVAPWEYIDTAFDIKELRVSRGNRCSRCLTIDNITATSNLEHFFPSGNIFHHLN